MVLIDSKKYACETCIKGHRSSSCKHVDRPLFEIKKKGRPVTQCEHCRELRKTKQVHVKCICEARDPPPPLSGPKKKGAPVLPAQAAFPHGVPGNTSTPTSDSEQGGSAPSVPGCTCKAGFGGCHCCTPRKRPGQRRSSPETASGAGCSSAPADNTSSVPISPPISNTSPTSVRGPSHHILARIAELRPVLPRLSARDAALQAQSGVQHDLFHGSGPHHHSDHFSPYGRAYDYALHGEGRSDNGFYQQDACSAESLLSTTSLRSVGSRHSTKSGPKSGAKSPTTRSPPIKSHNPRSISFDGKPAAFPGFFGAAQPTETEWRLPPSLSRASQDAPRPEVTYSRDAATPVFPPYPRSEGAGAYARSDDSFGVPAAPPRARSEDGLERSLRACSCGDGCACPGCLQHNVALDSNASPCCMDASCGGSCLNCTMMGLPDFSSVPGIAEPSGADATEADLDLEGYGTNIMYGPYEQIDEWIRDVEGMPPQQPFDFADGVNADMLDAATAMGDTWMFDLDVNASLASIDATRGFQGLSDSAVDFQFPSRSEMLTVPGPDAHRRSNSSSSASSEMSRPLVSPVPGGGWPAVPDPFNTQKEIKMEIPGDPSLSLIGQATAPVFSEDGMVFF